MGALGVPARAGATRVMLVEDSAVVRGMVRQWLEAVPGVEVVAAAINGKVAIDGVAAARPDIILLDIEMPVMDGMTALPELLRRAPQAKIILASTLSRRNAEVTLRAMSLGATDYVTKPSFVREGGDARNLFKDDLIRKVTGLAGIGQTQAAPSAGSTAETVAPGSSNWDPVPTGQTKFRLRPISTVAPRVLVIGSSTGGPAALSQVIADLRPVLGSVPVLIAQHMPPTFTALLGEKLAALGGLSGGEAVKGEPVVPGRLYVAPGGMHMGVRKFGAEVVITLEDGAPINHCKPSVEPLFASVASVYGAASLAAILTGMGSDGVQGAVRIADAGGTVFAQDEKSSVVWGMPGAAAARGACAGIVPLDKMGARLKAQLKGDAKS